MKRLRCWIASISVVLYTASLFLPTFTIMDAGLSGAVVFQIGWNALLCFEREYLVDPYLWMLKAAWLANPLIWAAIVAAYAGHRRVCQFTAGTAILLCLSVLNCWGEEIAPNPGYWAWLSSVVALATATCSTWAA